MAMEPPLKALTLWRYPWNRIVLLAVSLLLLGWLVNTPAGLLGKADAIGYAVCHRIDLRSFYLGDRQLPLCARCNGMYLGAMLGLAYQAALGSRRGGTPPKRVLAAAAALGLAFVVDGVNSFTSFYSPDAWLYQPQNWLRLATGTGMGLLISVALFPAFNQTVWKNWEPRPALSSLRTFAGLLTISLVLILLVLSENPLLLYPLALISAAGVLVLLSMVYCMLWLMVTRSENRYLKIPELFLPLTAGFGLALMQVALLDVARFWLTGTWDGFRLG